MSEPTSVDPAVSQLRQSDFEAFYRLHHRPVFCALASTLRDYDLAAEAVDEAMTRAFQRWRLVSRYENPSGWVYRVGLNWARSGLRRSKREQPVAEPPDVGYDVRLPNPDLDRAVARLDLSSRALVVLRYQLGWGYEEIAAALEMPVGTAKSRLHHAIEALRKSREVIA